MQDSLAVLVRGVDVSAIADQGLHKVQVDLGLLMGSICHLGKVLDQSPVAVDGHANVEDATAVSPDDVLCDEVGVDLVQTDTTHLGLVIIILTQQTR